MKDVDLPERTQIFVNQSLCLYYKIIAVKKKKVTFLGKNPQLLYFKQHNKDKTTRK